MRKVYMIFEKDCQAMNFKKLFRFQAEKLRKAGYIVEIL